MSDINKDLLISQLILHASSKLEKSIIANDAWAVKKVNDIRMDIPVIIGLALDRVLIVKLLKKNQR